MENPIGDKVPKLNILNHIFFPICLLLIQQSV